MIIEHRNKSVIRRICTVSPTSVPTAGRANRTVSPTGCFASVLLVFADLNLVTYFKNSKMSIKNKILEYVKTEGRSTTSEIANGIGYSQGYVRKNAKELVRDGDLNGEKVPSSVPVANIDGEAVVIVGTRSKLLNIIERYAPSKLPEAKSMGIDELQSLIKEIADDTYAFSNKQWEFWP